MRKIRKRVFVAVLAAALFFTMPGMVSYAEEEAAEMEHTSESVTMQEDADGIEKSGAESSEPEEKKSADNSEEDPDTNTDEVHEDMPEEPLVSIHEKDTEECICEILCTEDSINGDCPACGAEMADISHCQEPQGELETGSLAETLSIAEVSESPVASVTFGETTTRYTDFAEAWKDATAAKEATVTLLADVSVAGELYVSTGKIIVLTGEKKEDGSYYTLSTTGEATEAIGVNGGMLTVENCTVSGSRCGILVYSGTLVVDGGTLTGGERGLSVLGGLVNFLSGTASCTGTGNGTAGISITGGKLRIKSGEISSSGQYGLYVMGGDIDLYGGTYSGNNFAIRINDSISSNLSSLLPSYVDDQDRYAYYKGDDPLTDVRDKKSINQGVEVRECGHEKPAFTDKKDGTYHNKTCGACGETFAPEEHCPDNGYISDANGHYRTCADCKAVFGREDHTFDQSGFPRNCSVCGYKQDGVVKVEAAGSTKYYNAIGDAWTEAISAEKATVTLLADTRTSGTLYVPAGKQITLTSESNAEGKGYALSYSNIAFKLSGGELTVLGGTFSGSYSFVEMESGKLAINDGLFSTSGDMLLVIRGGTANIHDGTFSNDSAANLHQTGGMVNIDGGTFNNSSNTNNLYVKNATMNISGGTFTAANKSYYALYAASGSSVNITGGSFLGNDRGISVNQDANVKLKGGTFKGSSNAISISNNSSAVLGSLLDNSGEIQYAYYNDRGVIMDKLGEKKLTGTITVKECTHPDEDIWTYKESQTDSGRHEKICRACGYSSTESCSYGDEYGKDGTSHWKTCILCSGKQIEDHILKHAFTSGVYAQSCEICGYTALTGTYTVTPDTAVYYGGTEVTVLKVVTDPEVTFSDYWWEMGSDESDFKVISQNQTEYTLPADLPAGEYVYRYVGVTADEGKLICPICVTVIPAPLSADMVELLRTECTYSGAEQKPDVTVRKGEIMLTEREDYEVSCSRNDVTTTDLTNAGKITVTIEGKRNYAGTVTKSYTINKTNVSAGDLQYTPPGALIYTGKPIAASVTANGLTGIGQITVKYRKDNKGDFLTEAVDTGTYYVYAAISGATNYNDTQIEMGSFTISYMESPKDILYNNAAKVKYYGRAENGVAISAQGYTVSDVQNGGYKESFTIPVPAQTGTVTKTLYFSKDGCVSDGVKISVDFDLTPPTGNIKAGARLWETLMNAVTFGHYTANKCTVTIESDDTGGIGVGEIQYAVVEGDVQYTDAGELAKAAGITWTEYDNNDKPVVTVGNKCVIYARLTDRAGNVAYISTEGILLDETPPVVDGLTMGAVEARTAEFIFTVDEAADYYYVVLPESAGIPKAEDIIAGGTAITGSAASGKGEVKEAQLTGGKAAVNVTAGSLTPGMTYKVYVTAVDKTTDLKTGASAGNVGEVINSEAFTMKKLTPETPVLSYKVDRTDVNNVKITIIPIDGAQYRFGDEEWGSENEKAGFSTSDTVTLSIRLIETATHYESQAQIVTVSLAKEDRETPPAFILKYEANGETDYTVTIPPTEGCEYSFDGEHWSEDNVRTGVKAGETVTGYKRYKENNDHNASSAVSDSKQMPKFTVKTPVITPASGRYTGSVNVTITCGSPDAEIYYTTDGSTPDSSSTRYAGAFMVTSPATVKAIAIKEGFTDSTVATASYTKKSGGGNGSGSENNGGSSQGSGGNNGGGNTTPGVPAISSVTDTNPGMGVESVKSGTGDTVRPGTGTDTGSGTEQKTRPDAGIPFIKGEGGRTGWDVIREEEEKAEESSVINVDMNGTTVVPGDIFDSIKGRDITITFDMGNGIIWSVDGRSIITDKAGDIDLSVKTGENAIPVDVMNNVTEESYNIQISLAYEGEFGFTALLSIDLGKENAGYTASLYYYNQSAGELEFICEDEVAEDGTVSLAFTHASDYVIVVDEDEEESGTVTEPAEPGSQDENNTGAAEESPQAGQLWWVVVIGILLIMAGTGVFFVIRKKRERC